MSIYVVTRTLFGQPHYMPAVPTDDITDAFATTDPLIAGIHAAHLGPEWSILDIGPCVDLESEPSPKPHRSDQ